MATILFVEDDDMLQKLYAKILSMKGYHIIASAFDGVEAVDLYVCLNPKPDLVIMDYRMPRMDGIEATQELKRLNPSCKVLFLSADDSVREAAIMAGAVVFLVKPVSIDELLATIENLLESSQ